MAVAATPDRAPALPARRRRLYLPRRERIAVTIVLGLMWAGLSVVIDRAWIGDLAELVTLPVAIAIVAGIAIVPGYLNVQLVTSVVLDRPKRLPPYPPVEPAVTVLVAAYDEEDAIEQTLAAILAQDYAGSVGVLVIDDGSHDGTREVVRRVAAADPRVALIAADHGGKAAALNLGLACADTPLIATVDADTLLVPTALRRIITRLLVDPEGTVAVAGSVLVRNSRGGLVARMQEWDYQVGIAAVKRQQALLGATLVAQGAFSVYRTQAMRLAGGWPDRIGEDIVATWALIDHGGRTAFEPTAVGAGSRSRRRRSSRRGPMAPRRWSTRCARSSSTTTSWARSSTRTAGSASSPACSVTIARWLPSSGTDRLSGTRETTWAPLCASTGPRSRLGTRCPPASSSPIPRAQASAARRQRDLRRPVPPA